MRARIPDILVVEESGLPAGWWRGQNPHAGSQVWAGRLLAGVLAFVFACSPGTATRRINARPRVEPRDTHLVHEECPVTGGGAFGEDINSDGRPDRRTVSGPSGPRCITLDFDFDGSVDAWLYLDERGGVRRREHDFDGDGVADEIGLYRAGALVEQQRVTARAGKLDTWHYYSGGKLRRTERDSNGDDYVDQWWEYPAARGADCPLIHSDVDGDGRPDPGATVDLCRERAADTALSAPEEAAPGAATTLEEQERSRDGSPGVAEPRP